MLKKAFQTKDKKTLKTSQEIKSFCEYLKYASLTWVFLHEKNPTSCNEIFPLTPTIQLYLQKLQRLERRVFMHLLMAVFTQRNLDLRLKKYDEEEVSKLLKSMERFSFLVYEIAKKQTSITGEYFLKIGAKYFHENISLNDIVEDIENIIRSKYYFCLDDRNGFAFMITYENERYYSSKWRRGLKYLLYEYEISLKPENREVKMNFDESSIEHILPQNPDVGYSKKLRNYATKEGIVHALGNLLLIKGAINSELSNKSFQEKKEKFKQGSYSEIEVSNCPKTEWGKDEIKKRTEDILDFLFKNWNLQELEETEQIDIDKIKKMLLKDFK
ncbi:HNH endonuclease family protein [Helicobacter cetorum]|uniref:HNH endonuclease family protein n=1 Tax=Helicobacter cetorum TaxID=138563 RepID=UPI000CF0C07A|nr:HNH endonuclease family protein [Helicobacter cetorum]